MKDIRRADRVVGVAGHFKGKRGYVTRADEYGACVVWKGVWDHGIWTPIQDIKRTKRYKKDNGQ